MFEERISLLYPNDRYFAHLSVYHFVSDWCANKTVLDAGCGTGYGTNYLAIQGAKKVVGVDADRKTIARNQMQITNENVGFGVADLTDLSAFESRSFDVIVASNSLEHVEGVDGFFRSAWRLLKEDGILVVAVPAVRNEMGVAEELTNPYHLNIWSPEQWYFTQKLYFNSIRCFIHVLGRPDVTFQPRNHPKETTINETDFLFEEVELSNLYEIPTHSSIFVSTYPVLEKDLPAEQKSLGMRDFSVSRRMTSAGMRSLVWLYYRTRFILKYEGAQGFWRRIKSRFRQSGG